MGPKSSVTRVSVIREETQRCRHREKKCEDRGEKHVKTEAEIGVIQLLDSE